MSGFKLSFEVFIVGWYLTRPLRNWLVNYPGHLPFDRK